MSPTCVQGQAAGLQGLRGRHRDRADRSTRRRAGRPARSAARRPSRPAPCRRPATSGLGRRSAARTAASRRSATRSAATKPGRPLGHRPQVDVLGQRDVAAAAGAAARRGSSRPAAAGRAHGRSARGRAAGDARPRVRTWWRRSATPGVFIAPRSSSRVTVASGGGRLGRHQRLDVGDQQDRGLPGLARSPRAELIASRTRSAAAAGSSADTLGCGELDAARADRRGRAARQRRLARRRTAR